MSAPPVRKIPVRLPSVSSPVALAVRKAESPSSAPPAILLHGLGLSSYSWRYLQDRLAPHQATLAVDMLGFGRSDKPAQADYSLPGLADAVLALMDALGWERAKLVGHSLGGGAALLAAAKRPDRVESLALLGSVAYPQPEPPFVTLPRLPLAWLPMMLASRKFIEEGLKQVYLRPESLTPEAAEEYARPLRSFDGAAAYQRICRALRPGELQPYVDQFPALPTPLLILHGDRDNVVPPWVPERLSREVPHAEYHRLANAGHMLPEEEPERVTSALLDFWRER